MAWRCAAAVALDAASVWCAAALAARAAWRRWQPVEPKINFINRGSPHLIHQNEVTQIRVRKRVTVNCRRRHCVYLCLLSRRRRQQHADHGAAAIVACTAQDDIHEKKDKNTPLNEFPSG